ncbi:MAG: creatininase family protein [Acidobacteria bacterium]|nr:creatininase family protein [Acidobacteriota bacterium]
MEWIVQKEVKEEKIYNLFRCGYLDVRKWLEETDIVLIPLGSTEQHGRHLPVSTDSIATELPCQLAAELANVPHYQTIPFGYSPQHLHQPGVASGTVTLSASVYQNVLYEVGRSLIQNGFNKLIFATGHTSNMKAVDPALRTLRYETGAFVCCWRNDAEAAPALLADEGIIENPPEEAPGWHGSEVETSECLLFESMYGKKIVHLERTDKDFTHAPKWITDVSNKFTKANGSPYLTMNGKDAAWVPMDHQEYSDTGLVGNPGNPFRATAEKGQRIVRKKAELLAEFIEEIKKVKIEVKNRDYWNRAFRPM